ncbi:MAG: alpha-L-rhamnosidase C-terminal domain-containing protein [Anaerolineae bacterium]
MTYTTPDPTVDPRVRRYVMPVRIVWQTEGNAAPQHPEALLEAKDGQASLFPQRVCTLTHRGQAPGILLDFGRELQGGVQITAIAATDTKPVRLRVRFGESVSEAMSDVDPDGIPGQSYLNDHAIRDQTTLLPAIGSTEIGNTGFRFVRLDLVDEGKTVDLSAVRAIAIYRNLPYLGAFACSDERLNRIWQTGAYTVHLNMQGYVWDGIKRDRLVWIGDMHPETRVISTVFGWQDVVPSSLDFVRDGTPLPGWMNGISSYSIWWLLIQHHWHLYHGDQAYLAQQRGYLLGLLEQLLERIGPDGAERLDGRRFLDWPTADDDVARHAGLQAMMVLAMRAGAELCDTLGEAQMAARCRNGERALGQHQPKVGGTKQAAALLALAGLKDAKTMNEQHLAVGGARGMSTFYGYYMLQARAMAGDYQGALDAIRAYWGAMLGLGATTFWEDFDLAWVEGSAGIDDLVPPGKRDIHADFGRYCYQGLRHSLCHGWAGGPTAWLSEHVLGIRPAAPGFARVRIEPHLGDLDWAKGTFPTPHGLIRVAHSRRADGALESEVELPPGVERVATGPNLPI